VAAPSTRTRTPTASAAETTPRRRPTDLRNDDAGLHHVWSVPCPVTMTCMDPTMHAVVAERLPATGVIIAPDALELPLPPDRRRDVPPQELGPGSCVAVLLVDDEVSRAGDHAEELIDTLGDALEPGGLLFATVRNRVHATATHDALDGLRGFSASELRALVNHRGFEVELLAAPGAAARLRGDVGFDLDADRQPGLLDAAPRLLLVARAPRSAEERGRVFFDSRPRKIAAAAVLCRDPDGRLLVVYDRFKHSWTIPGGVVDADEDPASAAEREAWEEAGTKVTTDRLLGVFSSRWPDRLIFVFAGTPSDVVEHPQPLHPHEIGEVAWWSLEHAYERLAPVTAFKVRACLERPGRSWVQ
jgi:8-oxo-dGTP pyrophosphatase MutT (NUDIX family)